MNSVFFGLKRAYYGAFYATRKPLAEIGMSSARYDMLCAIRKYPRILQRDLRRVLGVVAATVCKMLKALEALGYVTRLVASDRRTRVVLITPIGKWAIRKSDDLMKYEGDGYLQGTPFVEIERAADARWYQLFNWDVDLLWYDEESDRMVRDLGMEFGPHPKWHPED